MSTERSDKIHQAHRQASEKFDYFILGLIGAVCAYISQTYHPERIGLTPNTLELAALIALFCSGVAGFRRIETTVRLFGENYLLLRAFEERGSLSSSHASGPLINTETGEVYSHQAVAHRILVLDDSIPRLRSAVEKTASDAKMSYQWRNRLLFLGFVFIVGSKIWAAYV